VTDPSLPTTAPPADWYPDPSGEWEHRYWNGHSWTAHVSRAGVAYVDPHTAHLPTGRDQQLTRPEQLESGVEPEGTAPQETDDALDQLLGQIAEGRLPEVADPPILTRHNERVHGVFRAELVREQAAEDHPGATVLDAGLLVVTSTRTVFTGRGRGLQLRHDKVVDVEERPDGLRLRAAEGPDAPFFRFVGGCSPRLAAALLTAVRAQA